MYSLHRYDEIKEIHAFCNEVAFLHICLHNKVGSIKYIISANLGQNIGKNSS